MVPSIRQPPSRLGAFLNCPKPNEKMDRNNVSHRRTISRQTGPREAGADAQRRKVQSQCVHLDFHGMRDLASVPKER